MKRIIFILFILIYFTFPVKSQISQADSTNFFFKVAFDSLGECYGKSLIQEEWDTIWKDEIIKPNIYTTDRVVNYIHDTIFFDFYFLTMKNENINLLLPFIDTSEIEIIISPEYREYKPIYAEYEMVTEQYIINHGEKKWENYSTNITNSNNWKLTEAKVKYGTRTKNIIRTPGHNLMNQYHVYKERTMKVIKVMPKENILPYQINNIKLLCKKHYPFIKEKIIYTKRKIQKETIEKKAFPFLKKNGNIKTTKIYCNLNKRIIIQLQKQLYAQGFYSGNFQGEFNDETKAAIIKYQVKNNLPIGQLDNETVNHILSRKTPFHN